MFSYMWTYCNSLLANGQNKKGMFKSAKVVVSLKAETNGEYQKELIIL